MYFELHNDDMESSKHCSIFISLLFIVKCFTRPFIIRNLQRDNQLSLFRRLEHLSVKQLKCVGAIIFLQLCENFGLTPTFAKIDETKYTKELLKAIERIKTDYEQSKT